MSDRVEDKAEDSENQNQNEDDKILKDEVKNTEVIQVEEISGNSKKKIIIFIVLGIVLIIIAITLILAFTLKNKGDILPPFVMNATSGNHTHTIIFMPGLTNQPEDFNRTFSEKMQFTKKKDTTIVILRSPLAYVTILNSKNYSWFDIFKIPVSDYSDVNIEELKTKSAKILEQFIDNEVNILNGDYSKIIIGGHSQGASIALYQAYNANKVYGGLFSFSGILPPVDIKEDKKNLKAWIGYGDKDNIITPSFMNKSYSPIEHFEGVEIHIYPNYTHSVRTKEAEDAAKFLDKIIK